MWSTWFVFLLMWIGFTWALLSKKTKESNTNIKITTLTFKSSCSKKTISCVNVCSFLCVETNAKCINGVCEVQEHTIDCDSWKGGKVMMVNELISYWTCICTNPSFFGGNNFGTLNPDICEHGSFLYKNENTYNCFCPAPYKLLEVNNKPHCVEKKIAKSFANENIT